MENYRNITYYIHDVFGKTYNVHTIMRPVPTETK